MEIYAKGALRKPKSKAVPNPPPSIETTNKTPKNIGFKRILEMYENNLLIK